LIVKRKTYGALVQNLKIDEPNFSEERVDPEDPICGLLNGARRLLVGESEGQS